MNRLEEAQGFYALAMEKVKRDEPQPEGQKFSKGQRVHICKDLGVCMSHFPNDVDATVKYSYEQAFGDGELEEGEEHEYCLDLDGHGEVSWYNEWQLTAK